MAKSKKIYDAVISYAMGDASFAEEVINACRINGLETFSIQNLPPAARFGDATREAIAESRALIIVLSSTGPTTAMLLEIGAALAWNTPIFTITTDPSSLARLPAVLSKTPVYTIGRIEEVIAAIKASGEQLSDEDRKILAKLYVQSGAPVDQLAMEPQSLRKIVDKFRKGTGKAVEGERLLSEMLRMRKQGRLTFHRRGKTQARPHRVN